MYLDLNSNSPIYAKTTTYAYALDVQANLVIADVQKAFPNVPGVKISKVGELDTKAAFNAFISIFQVSLPVTRQGLSRPPETFSKPLEH